MFAIIGDNGTGKTTILKILNQVLKADSGSFRLGSNVKIGYYDQEHHVLHMEKLFSRRFPMTILILITRRSVKCWQHFYLPEMMYLNLLVT